MKSTYTA